MTQGRQNTQLSDVWFVRVINHRLVHLAKLSLRLITNNKQPFNGRNTLRTLHRALLATNTIPLRMFRKVVVLTGNKLKITDATCEMPNSFPLYQGGSGVPRGGGGFAGGSNPPATKFRRPSTIVPNSTRLWKLLKKLLNLGHQHPKMFGKKGSKILKLPRFAIVLH